MAWRRRSAAPQSSSSSASSPPPRAPISSSPGGSEGCFMLVGTDKNTSRINTIGKESWSKMLARSLSLKSCWLFPTYGEADDQVRTCTATGRCSYGAVLLKVLTVRVLVDGFMGPVSSAATMWFVH